MSDASAVRAGRAYVELYTTNNKLSAGLDAAGREVRKWGADIMKVGAGVFAAGSSISAAMVLMARSAANSNAELAIAAQRASTTISGLSALKYAAEQCGIDFHKLTTRVGYMNRFLGDVERGGHKDAMKSMGMSVADLAGKTGDERFRLFAEKLKAIKDPALQTSLAIAVFGRGAIDILPLLRMGAEGIDQFTARAKAMGIVVGKEEAEAGLKFSRTMGDVGKVLSRLNTVIGNAIIPQLLKMAEWLVRAGAAAIKFVQDHQALVVKVFEIASIVTIAGAAIVGFGAIIYGVGVVVGAASVIVGAFVGVIGTVASVITTLATTGLGLLISGLAAVGAYFLWTSKAAQGAFNWIATAWGNIAAQFMSNVGVMLGSWEGFTTVMKHYWAETVFAIKDVWIDFKGWFANTINGLSTMINVFFEHALNGAVDFVSGLNDIREAAANYLSDKVAAVLITRNSQQYVEDSYGDSIAGNPFSMKETLGDVAARQGNSPDAKRTAAAHEVLESLGAFKTGNKPLNDQYVNRLKELGISDENVKIIQNGGVKPGSELGKDMIEMAKKYIASKHGPMGLSRDKLSDWMLESIQKMNEREGYDSLHRQERAERAERDKALQDKLDERKNKLADIRGGSANLITVPNTAAEKAALATDAAKEAADFAAKKATLPGAGDTPAQAIEKLKKKISDMLPAIPALPDLPNMPTGKDIEKLKTGISGSVNPWAAGGFGSDTKEINKNTKKTVEHLGRMLDAIENSCLVLA